jgi:hypothetical protein
MKKLKEWMRQNDVWLHIKVWGGLILLLLVVLNAILSGPPQDFPSTWDVIDMNSPPLED